MSDRARRHVATVIAFSILVLGVRAPALGATGATTSHGLQEPNFTDLPKLTVSVDGKVVALGDSSLTYRRRTAAAFDDPNTPGYDGIARTIRAFLACETDAWTMGSQIFTVDAIAVGNARNDRSLVERGVDGLDWGVGQHIDDEGVHTLERSCDGKTVSDFGGTHHTTQWLAALGEAVHQLRASPFADEFRARTDVYVSRMEEIARLLVRKQNWRAWQRRWLVDQHRNLFTHKTYMMAAALGLTASLTTNRADASRWTAIAESIARRGMRAQRGNGVHPERGGYDVAYQAYGAWLAELYYSTLPPGSLQRELRGTIDRALAWLSSRVDDHTGQMDIGASTRVCNPADESLPYEAADAVRAFLTWGVVRSRPDLVDRAVFIDHGAKVTGDPCP